MTSAQSEFVIFDEQLRADRQYWKSRLSSDLQPSNIWPDQRRKTGAAEYARFEFPFQQALCLQLAKLTGDSSFLLYTVFVAALGICLRRYSGRNTVVIGSSSLKHPNSNASPNLIVVVNEADDEVSFRNVLLHVRQTLLDGYAHQMYPLSLVMRDLGLSWNEQRNPLFDIVTGMEGIHDEIPPVAADMKLWLTRNGDRIGVEVEYDRRLYEEASVNGLLRCMSQVAESGLRDPNELLMDLRMAGAEEERMVVSEWNRTKKIYDERNVVELFEEQARRQPDADAVVSAEDRISYGELNGRANQLARHLRKKGVKRETLVGVVMERSPEMLVALLGVLKAGGAYVPVDPAYPEERIRYMLEDAAAGVVLTQKRFASSIAGADPIVLDHGWDQLANESTSNPENYAGWENLAYVIYTSGSSGSPKGVEVTHQSLANLVDWHRGEIQVTPEDRATLLAAPAFDASVHEIWPCLSAGACLYIADHQTRSFPPRLVSWLADRKITFCFLSTSLVQPVLQEVQPGQLTLRAIITGGERLRPQCVNAIPFSLINHYGPTENTVVATFAPVVDEGEKDPPIGKPIANVQVYVLDQYLHPLPVGIPGELYIGGIGLARGYHRKPDLTAERFIPNPFGSRPGTRLYGTGDVVRYRRDGQLEFIGRNDDQVKVSGYRIEPREVEIAIESYPSVSQSVVLARDGPAGGNRLVAYFTGKGEQKPDVENLRSYLKDKLPHFMIPSAFVQLAVLPLTANGKINRKALPDAPGGRGAKERAAREVNSPIEELVARVYAEVLNITDIDIEDNFFAMGGNSLHATQTMSRINNLLQIETPLQSIFESPTVAGLAARIESRLRSGAGASLPAIRRIPRSGTLPLSFAQERLWVMHRLDPSGSVYNVPGIVRITGSLDHLALEHSLTEIIRRHECLRTVFADQDEESIGLLISGPPRNMGLADLRHFTEQERKDKAADLAREDARKPFDLARGPLLRATLVHMADEEYVLLLTMHHIVTDGWSVGVFLREMMSLYEAFRNQLPSPLPELRLQYADFAAWQRELLKSGALDVQQAYWRRRLEGAAQLLDLPTDRPRPAVQTFGGAAHRVLLPMDFLNRLEAFTHREHVTLFMLLLAAFQVILHRYSKSDDIVVGTDIANRNRLELEDLIGFFVNNLALRTDLSGNPDFREILKRVRKVTLEGFAHQDFPFDRLVKSLNPRRQRSYMPLIQVLLVLQNAPLPALAVPDLAVTPVEFDTDTCKFDIAVMNSKSDAGLVQTWTYNTDIFDASTIRQMAANFAKVLLAILDKPDIGLHSLDSLIQIGSPAAGPQERPMQKPGTISEFSRKPLNMSESSLVRMSYLDATESLPLIIGPNMPDVDLEGWAQSNRAFIETNLLKHGAILFRGFQVSSAALFERFAKVICHELFGEYGDLPREAAGGKVYGSTPYPPEKAILFHNESSHMLRWPLKIWFNCIRAAAQGGETPIVDCRNIYRLLDPALRRRFEEKGLMYVRNFAEGLDVRWQEFFRTDGKAEAEEKCRLMGMNFEWKGRSLKTRQVCAAVKKHPKTGETVFFNQIQLHHPACLDEEVRSAVLSMFTEEEAPRNVYYGDGSPIEDSVAKEITDIYMRAAVSFPWQEGDVLMVDNMLAAHARNPFQGERKILVVMGDMTS